MREFGLKLCLFLFLVALLSGRTNELGTLAGAVTGTILLWPAYKRLLPPLTAKPRYKAVIERRPETTTD